MFTNSELLPILGPGLDGMSDGKGGSSTFNELLLLWVLLILLTSKYDSNGDETRLGLECSISSSSGQSFPLDGIPHAWSV